MGAQRDSAARWNDWRERCVHVRLAVRIQHAHAVRADHAEAVRANPLDELCLKQPAFVSGLGESCRDDDERLDPGARALIDDVEDERTRHRDDREVDPTRCVDDAGVTSQSVELRRLRVDGINATAKAAGNQRAQYSPSDARRLAGRTDHRDRRRLEQRPNRCSGRGCDAAFSSSESLVRRAERQLHIDRAALGLRADFET